MAKILIVDDDPDVVDACRLFLEKKGFNVSAAYNRVEGMSAIQSFKPDLVILDVMMDQPDDGIAMAQDLRRQGFKAPILMLTSISKVTGMTLRQGQRSRAGGRIPGEAGRPGHPGGEGRAAARQEGGLGPCW